MVESYPAKARGIGLTTAQLPELLSGVTRGLRNLGQRTFGVRDKVTNTSRNHEGVNYGEILTPPKGVELLSQEHKPGVLLVPSGGDTIVIFQGEAYLNNLPYLIRVATTLLHRNVGWDEEFCREAMIKGMGVEDLLPQGAQLDDKTKARLMTKRDKEIPSVFLYRAENLLPYAKEEEEGKPAGEYAEYYGISVQRMLFIKTILAGEVSLLDHVLRAFEPGARFHYRGRASVGLAIVRHGRPSFYRHKTGNPQAAATNRKSGYLVQEGAFPFAAISISDPLMREVNVVSAERMLLPGRVMDAKGVIKGDYPQPNRGFNPKELQGEAMEMYRLMKEELGMHIDYENYDGSERFDSVAPLYMVR